MAAIPQKIRWGILGTGSVAGKFAHDLGSSTEAKLLAVASRSQVKVETFAKHCKIPRAYGSYMQLLEDPDIDVVYVATPNAYHKEHCLLALDAGKAVLCEKPFALNASEAQAVIQQARRKQLFCMEAMWMRFVPAIQTLRELLEQQVIGKICQVNMQMGFAFPFDPSHRVFDPKLGGGALLDLGVYPLSLASYLLGTPVVVQSDAVIGATGVDEKVAMVLRYPEGQHGLLSASLRNPTANDAVIMGTEGCLRVHAPLYCPQSLSLKTASNSLLTRLKNRLFPSGSRIVRRTQAGGYQYQAIEVMRCLRAGDCESPIMPLNETLSILEVMDVVRQQWTVSTY